MLLEAFSRVLPVLLLVGLGVFIRQRGFLRPATIDDLRKTVLTITLPAALFLAMLKVEISGEYGVIVAAVFGACVVMLLAAPYLRRPAGIGRTLRALVPSTLALSVIPIGVFLVLAFGLVFILCIATLLLHASRNSQYPISNSQ